MTYKKLIDNMTFSFSRLRAFEQCKYEWYMNYVLQDVYEKEQNFYAGFGSFCHKLLESILKGYMDFEEAISYYQNNFYTDIDCFDISDSIKENYFYLGLDYFANADFDWLNAYEVLGIEKKCVFTFEGKKFIGYIDLLIREKSTQNIIIIDHKSSEYPLSSKGKVLAKEKSSFESYKKQLYLYSEAIYQEHGSYPTKLCWNYFKTQKWLSIPFVHKEFEAAKKWALGVISMIYNERDFLPAENWFYCNHLCSYRNSCDYKLMGGDDDN